MSPFYRPSSFSARFGADSATPATGSVELSHAGLSAGVETQLTAPADISKAHNFFQPPIGSDAGVLGSQVLTPGAESAAMSVAPIIPGANEPISPLIQLIMRLPGHLGIMNSFFEALGHLFAPDLSMFGSLDPSLLAHQAHAALNSLAGVAGEHLPIDPSLLPSDAPIFQSSNGQGLLGMKQGGLDSVTGKVSASAGEHMLRNPLECSGQFKPNNPHFEAAGGGQLSGAEMSSAMPASHLAGHSRLFSDKLGGLGQGMSSTASGTTQSLPNSLNVGATTFPQQLDGLPAAGRLGDGIGNHPGQGYGPSGAVSDRLGEPRLLATESTPSFRPTLGDSGSFDSATYTPSSSAVGGAMNAQAAGQGLKATQLTLPGVKTAPVNHVMDRIGHQTKIGSHPSHNGMDEISHRSLLKTRVGHAGDHHAGLADHKPAHGKLLNESDAPKAASSQKVAQAEVGRTTDAAAATDAPPTSYTIRAGDCLWNIARDHLGSGARWQEIYNLNADLLGKNPDLIHTGIEIKLPGAGGDIASGGGELSNYLVKSGDNLWNIARDHLGGGQNWGQIYQMNHDVIGANPRLIFPGQQLSLNGAEGGSQMVASASTSAPTAVAQAAPQAAAPASYTGAAGSGLESQGTIDNATAVPTATPAQMAGPAGRLPSFNSESLAPSSLRPDLGALMDGRSAR
jgi:LysM repeat protein